MEQELIKKYENLGFLKGIEDSKKEEYIQLFEDSADLLEQVREINKKIEVMFLPVIAHIYRVHNTANCKQILSDFRIFLLENLEKYKTLHVENVNFDYEAELCYQFVKSYEENK